MKKAVAQERQFALSVRPDTKNDVTKRIVWHEEKYATCGATRQKEHTTAFSLSSINA